MVHQTVNVKEFRERFDCPSYIHSLINATFFTENMQMENSTMYV
jgi:hypothetical protein